MTQSSAQVAAAGKSGGGCNSATNSGGDDMRSTSTSSPDSKNPGTVETTGPQMANLSGENEKLRKDNEMLSRELAQAKKQCDELVSFLMEYVKVGPDQIHRIMRQGSCGSSRKHDDDDENTVGEGGESLKLFGVWLKGHKEKKEKEKISTTSNGIKRGREDQMGCTWSGPHAKELKTVDFSAPVIMNMKSSKVCN